MRSIRFTLAFAFIITTYFAYVMLATTPNLFDIYQVEVFDPMHRYLSMVGGSLLVVIAIATGLAFLKPVKYTGIVIVLILYHLVRFIVDMILVAQGDIAWNILLPEMVYFIVVCAALIRFFPTKPKKESKELDKTKETEEEVQITTIIDNNDANNRVTSL